MYLTSLYFDNHTIYYYLNSIVTYRADYKHSLQTSNHVLSRSIDTWIKNIRYKTIGKRERETHTEKKDKGEKVGKKSVRKKTSPYFDE